MAKNYEVSYEMKVGAGAWRHAHTYTSAMNARAAINKTRASVISSHTRQRYPGGFKVKNFKAKLRGRNFR
jgi:hypothetical protein